MARSRKSEAPPHFRVHVLTDEFNMPKKVHNERVTFNEYRAEAH